MAKVYTVSYVHDWEEDNVFAIFSTPRKAKAFLSQMIYDPDAKSIHDFADSYHIDEFPVDARKSGTEDDGSDAISNARREIFTVNRKDIAALRKKKGLKV